MKKITDNQNSISRQKSTLQKLHMKQTFLDKHKLREFTSSRTALKKILKVVSSSDKIKMIPEVSTEMQKIIKSNETIILGNMHNHYI